MVISVPFVLLGGYVAFSGLSSMHASDIWTGLGIAVLWPAGLYLLGSGVAWVRRGFRDDKTP